MAPSYRSGPVQEPEDLGGPPPRAPSTEPAPRVYEKFMLALDESQNATHREGLNTMSSWLMQFKSLIPEEHQNPYSLIVNCLTNLSLLSIEYREAQSKVEEAAKLKERLETMLTEGRRVSSCTQTDQAQRISSCTQTDQAQAQAQAQAQPPQAESGTSSATQTDDPCLLAPPTTRAPTPSCSATAVPARLAPTTPAQLRGESGTAPGASTSAPYSNPTSLIKSPANHLLQERSIAFGSFAFSWDSNANRAIFSTNRLGIRAKEGTEQVSATGNSATYDPFTSAGTSAQPSTPAKTDTPNSTEPRKENQDPAEEVSSATNRSSASTGKGAQPYTPTGTKSTLTQPTHKYQSPAKEVSSATNQSSASTVKGAQPFTPTGTKSTSTEPTKENQDTPEVSSATTQPSTSTGIGAQTSTSKGTNTRPTSTEPAQGNQDSPKVTSATNQSSNPTGPDNNTKKSSKTSSKSKRSSKSRQSGAEPEPEPEVDKKIARSENSLPAVDTNQRSALGRPAPGNSSPSVRTNPEPSNSAGSTLTEQLFAQLETITGTSLASAVSAEELTTARTLESLKHLENTPNSSTAPAISTSDNPSPSVRPSLQSPNSPGPTQAEQAFAELDAIPGFSPASALTAEELKNARYFELVKHLNDLPKSSTVPGTAHPLIKHLENRPKSITVTARAYALVKHLESRPKSSTVPATAPPGISGGKVRKMNPPAYESLELAFDHEVHLKDNKVHILLAATGSVATIKIPVMIRELAKLSKTAPPVSIRLILTIDASGFLQGQAVEQPDFDDLAKIPCVDGVYTDDCEWKVPWVRGNKILHIELRRWADIMVVAPLSANSLAKIAVGVSDNLLLNTMRAWDIYGNLDARHTIKFRGKTRYFGNRSADLSKLLDENGAVLEDESDAGMKGRSADLAGQIDALALEESSDTTKRTDSHGRKRILVAPAMNPAMWNHPVTKKHMAVLQNEWGVGVENGWIEVLGPITKTVACGDSGPGAMMEATDIVKRIWDVVMPN